MTGRALIDAHHHLWDIGRLDYPWLQGEGEPGFFLGDYRALRRNYLPEDFRRDTASVRLLASVHCEAEHSRADPVAETRWLTLQQACTGLPSVLVAWAPLLSPAAEGLLEVHQQSPLLRGIRYKPLTARTPGEIQRVRGQPGQPARPGVARGAGPSAATGPELGPARALVAPGGGCGFARCPPRTDCRPQSHGFALGS
ncbi:hypothetical protein Q3H58_000199 [Pseudomonas psychrotolerans]|nr:hypothetical protein [Pseudomonas psychrotolerans]